MFPLNVGGSGQSTGKTVAIIVGVTAGVGFLIILVLFVRGLKKKDDGMIVAISSFIFSFFGRISMYLFFVLYYLETFSCS